MRRDDKALRRPSAKVELRGRDESGTQILAAIVESSDAAIIGKTLEGICRRERTMPSRASGMLTRRPRLL